MAKKVTVQNGGISFLGGLTLLFIALKLLDKIDWSWWMVLSPLWIPPLAALLFTAGVLFVIGLVFFVAFVWDTAKAKAKKKR